MSEGTATEIQICGRTIRLGDHLKVKYTKGTWSRGGTIKGTVTELWSLELDNHLQGRLSNGWCFHDCDEILSHSSKSQHHFGDPCIYCGTPHDDVEPGSCPAFKKESP